LSLSASLLTKQVVHVHFGVVFFSSSFAVVGLGVAQQTHLSLASEFETKHVVQDHLAAFSDIDWLTKKPDVDGTSTATGAAGAAGAAAGAAAGWRRVDLKGVVVTKSSVVANGDDDS
jgi:hypothetical protein